MDKEETVNESELHNNENQSENIQIFEAISIQNMNTPTETDIERKQRQELESLEKQIYSWVENKINNIKFDPHVSGEEKENIIKGSIREWILEAVVNFTNMTEEKEADLKACIAKILTVHLQKLLSDDSERKLHMLDSVLYSGYGQNKNYCSTEENFVENHEYLHENNLLNISAHKSITDENISESETEQLNFNDYRFTYPQISFENTVTVKFVLQQNDQILTRAFSLQSSIFELKETLSILLHLSVDNIHLSQNDTALPNDLLLSEMGVEAYGTTEIVVSTGQKDILKTWMFQNEYFVPDVITVTTGKDGTGEFTKEIVVEIENKCKTKPFLGGYKHKITGREYHHAEAQTHAFANISETDKFNAATQTVIQEDNGVNTVKNVGIQMSKHEYLIPQKGDKIIMSKTHTNTILVESLTNEQINNQVVIIQRYIRGWIARKKFAWRKQEQKKEFCKRISNEFSLSQNIELRDFVSLRRAFPKTKSDFDILYTLVERWRQSQINNIKEKTNETSKKALFCLLLEKEIKLLYSIEKYKIQARDDFQERKELEQLEKNTKPKTWKSYNGLEVSMETICTQRARELKELYLTICNKSVTMEERVEQLISLKYALRKYKSPLVNEISKLLDQECNFLVTGLTHKELHILRKRIKRIFLDFIRDPLIISESM